MNKIIVTGASGLLGSKIIELAKSDLEVIPTHHTRPLFTNSIKLDVTNSQESLQIFQQIKPDTVIHTAAETNVDRCETDRDWAWKANTQGTRNVAKACKKVGAKLIYISTDYVFDGEKGLYAEDDQPNPVNYYGFTKLKGEELVKECCDNYLIARASVLYGWHPWKTNFATWVTESIKHGKSIEVVDNHYNSPTLADNLAEALLEIVRRDLGGIYHTAGSERVSRYEFAKRIAKTFDLNVNLIKPIKMSELKVWVAKRPSDSSLCIKKAQKELKTRFLNVQEGLDYMKMNRHPSFFNTQRDNILNWWRTF